MSDEVHDYIRYWRERAIKAEEENALPPDIDTIARNLQIVSTLAENQQLKARIAVLESEYQKLANLVAEMNDLQRKIILERARRRTAEEEIIRLRHALEEIRDLVRTGLKPDIYPDEESWNRSKLRSIVNMASVALQEVRGC